MKVLSVFGTRPEAIKMAPVLKVMGEHTDLIESSVCVTAQHREMLDQILGLFGVMPDHDLDVMREDQSLTQLTAMILTGLESILIAERPDLLLVQGDTTSVMSASVLAFYHGIEVGHVEAGLRTGDKYRPFPEEVNRRVVSMVADFHFAPTSWARDNLLREGVAREAIYVTGNPVIDAMMMIAERPYDGATGPLAGLPWDRRILLVTAHRRENFGKPLKEICRALIEIARRYPDDVHIVYPVHLNPNVQHTVYSLLQSIPNITLIAPLDYFSMIHLMKRCYLVLTDSGGIQEEAPGLGKPVLVLRDETERPEGVEAGTARLAGTKSETIVAETKGLLDDRAAYQQMAQTVNPYGDGHAAERIVQAILQREVPFGSRQACSADQFRSVADAVAVEA